MQAVAVIDTRPPRASRFRLDCRVLIHYEAELSLGGRVLYSLYAGTCHDGWIDVLEIENFLGPYAQKGYRQLWSNAFRPPKSQTGLEGLS